MKKKILLLLLIILIFISGCLKRDSMEGISIHTTIYPVRYLIDTLYKDNAKIYSIYPSGADIDTYKFSNKQIHDYSKSTLFVFNSKREQELNTAVKLINKNKNLKIIDVASGMNYTYSVEELWLDPYNYLMMAGNIKTGLDEYITNPYLIKEIEDNYKVLQLALSELDAEIKEAVINSEYDTIVVDNNALEYLEKYGLTVISLDDSTEVLNKTIEQVKSLLKEGKIKNIYTINNKDNTIIKELVENNSANVVKLNSMYSIDGEITDSNQSYLTITKNNIDLIKDELYK